LFCRDGDDQSLNLTASFGCFFGEGAMRQTRGCLGNTPLFFWQFVNDAHGIEGWLKRVVWLGRQHLRRIRPLVDGRHSLPPFFCLCSSAPWPVSTTCADGSPTPFHELSGGKWICRQTRDIGPWRWDLQGFFV